jgi:DNA polymerase III delta subunit
LVVVAGVLDERRRVTKRLLARATVVRCGTLEDVGDAQRWIRAQMKATEKTMAPEAVHELAARVGPDIGRLRGEVERLLLFAGGRSSISVADMREVAGPAGAHDDWAVARAIERGQTAVALRELGLALEAGAVPYMVLGQLAWVVRARLPGARVPAAVEAVVRTDLALKSSGGEPRVLLERLVIELCATGGSGSR